MNLRQKSKSFMRRRVSRMNPSAANLAVMHAKIQRAVQTAEIAKCSRQLAHLAVKPAKFLLNLVKIVLYTAAIALQTEDNINKVWNVSRKGHIFFGFCVMAGAVFFIKSGLLGNLCSERRWIYGQKCERQRSFTGIKLCCADNRTQHDPAAPQTEFGQTHRRGQGRKYKGQRPYDVISAARLGGFFVRCRISFDVAFLL